MNTRKFELFPVINTVFLILVCFTMLYPFWNSLVKSFSSNAEIMRGNVYIWPKGLNVKGYELLFQDSLFYSSLLNSVFIVITGTIIRLVCSLLAGYAFSKRYLAGNRILFMVFLLTMFFNGGIVPTFIIVNKLGLYNNRWALILTSAMPVYHMILARSFFERLPSAIEESAFIDGAGYFTIFFKIVLPVSMALIATLVIFNTVFLWNIFIQGIIYIQDSSKYPLQVFVRIKVFEAEQVSADPTAIAALQDQLDKDAYGTETMKMAVLTVTSIPIILIYPFFQRYFIKGVTLGAVKS
jgi:putative aldouronate transport system permease protein